MANNGPITDERLRDIIDTERAKEPRAVDAERIKMAAEILVRRDQCKQSGVLSFAERSLVRDVCHDLINRAMRAERESGGADERAKEAAIRKLLGDRQ